ncbi:uncharacterized protein LOC101451466 [Ceratitis capitata]|uniref:uncharacterized protein LOC101451466 n=1 Tax=Ceratitis capitata TaxID=7213 RepID=UPI000329AA55|nr:uncharacterized protein LOC101451466 [Ceratitis capitata]
MSSEVKIISDCSTITSATAEYVPNPNTTCNSRYPFIYCNAELSAYCTQDECIDEFECEREEELSAASDSEDQVTSTSTMKMTTISTHPGTRRTTAKVKTTTLEPTKPTAVAITATTKTIATIPIISTQATKTITTTTTTGNPTIEPNINPTTIEALNIRQLCRIGITENYPYMRNCRYYYRCTNGYLLFQECPYLMSFDVYNGYCKHAREARCLKRKGRGICKEKEHESEIRQYKELEEMANQHIAEPQISWDKSPQN